MFLLLSVIVLGIALHTFYFFATTEARHLVIFYKSKAEFVRKLYSVGLCAILWNQGINIMPLTDSICEIGGGGGERRWKRSHKF